MPMERKIGYECRITKQSVSIGSMQVAKEEEDDRWGRLNEEDVGHPINKEGSVRVYRIDKQEEEDGDTGGKEVR